MSYLFKHYSMIIAVIALTVISCNNSPKDLPEGIELGDNISELEESGWLAAIGTPITWGVSANSLASLPLKPMHCGIRLTVD